MTAPLTPEREAEIRDLEQAAALGPWLNDGAEFYQAPHGYIEIDRWVGETLDIENDEQSTANAAFVAAARTAVPELLAELDRLRSALSDAADQVAERDDELGSIHAEVDRLRNETAGLRQGIERQEARTEHIAKQALRWKAEADGRKEYGEKLRAELAALPAPVVEQGFRDEFGTVHPLTHFPAETVAQVLKTNPALQRTVRISEWTEVAS